MKRKNYLCLAFNIYRIAQSFTSWWQSYLAKALTEHFSQKSVPIRHLLNAKPTIFLQWCERLSPWLDSLIQKYEKNLYMLDFISRVKKWPNQIFYWDFNLRLFLYMDKKGLFDEFFFCTFLSPFLLKFVNHLECFFWK